MIKSMNKIIENIGKPKDNELLSLFKPVEEDDDSDEEYYPWKNSGKCLREVERPYDKTMKILQCNKELFSQPLLKRKKVTLVQFDPIPKLIILDENLNVIATTCQPSIAIKHANKEEIKRRQTPAFIQPPPSIGTASKAPRVKRK